MKQKIFIVIGAFGHLGNVIVRFLKQLNLKIRCFVLPGDTSSLENEFPDLDIIRGDITIKDSLNLLFTHNDNEELFVIHAAGIVSIYKNYSSKMEQVNVLGTKNIIEKALEFNVKKLLYVSSVHAIYPNKKNTVNEPNDFNPDLVYGAYAKTKAAATKLILENKDKLNVVVVLPSGIIGPYDTGTNHTTMLITKIMEDKLKCGVKGGYDFVDVRDVASGCYKALMNSNSGDCYILSNQNYKIQEIFDIVTEIQHLKKRKVFLPLWFAKIFSPICEFFYKQRKLVPLFTSYSLYTLNEKVIFSHEKATIKLDYNPRSLKRTIKDTIIYLNTIKELV